MISALRNRWHRWAGVNDSPLDGDTPAWLMSLLVNMGVMIALGLIPLDAARQDEDISLAVAPTVEEVLPDVAEPPPPQEFYFSETPEEKIGANSVGGVDAALAQAPNVAKESNVPLTAEVEVDPVVTSEIGNVKTVAVSAIKVQEDVLVATGPNFSENQTVRGAAVGVGSTGAVGAIDRITHEILRSLEERKTLVVWLYDQTPSLEPQRKAINGRMDRIYEELGVIEASNNPAFKKHDSKPLLSAVVGFGEKVVFLTPQPTDSVGEIKSAVSSMPHDNKGIENVFTAIFQTAERYLPYRTQKGRNIMIVALTDEVGNDQEAGLDPTVRLCRKHEIPVYCIGVPAPFGRPVSAIKWIDPDPKYDQSPQWAEVQQGPESLRPELVKLAFSASGDADEPIDSGFGPYSLTRLCYETGGIYFAVHPNRNATRAVTRQETDVLSAYLTRFFDPTIMRNYRPDYLSVQQYDQMLRENKARAALVAASMETQRSGVAVMDRPRTHFPKVSDADLANQLSNAQRAAAVVEPRVNAVYEVLRQGEKDREKITQPRWQAGYDLALGRVLAIKIRTEGYNAMLAKAKQGLKFKNPKNDTWDLKPSSIVASGSVHEKLAAQARTLLESVVREHANTPWAMIAERELREPLGWEWVEAYTGVNKPRVAMGGGNAPAPRDDRRQMLAKPKERRAPPKQL